MENIKYKVGDKVRIKSIDWYNNNKGTSHCVNIGDKKPSFTYGMSKYCGLVLTIDDHSEYEGEYYMVEDDGVYTWTDEMIEGLVEESDDFDRMYMESEKRYKEEYSKNEYCHEQSFKWGFQEGYDYAHEKEKLEINLKNGYEFKDEHGNVINATKIILEKKKKEYPKTYEECLKVLNIEGGRLCFNNSGITQYERGLYIMMNKLSKLLICRDAYWKLYGEEMGLGKPWKPNWSIYKHKFCLGTDKDKVIEECVTTGNRVLAFPTKEMRDAFYENFKELIEQCKGLL